jgi:predicted component of type VI protein secretion system
VFVIVVVVLFCLALFMMVPHAVKSCSWLLERLSVYALFFSESSKWFSGYLETKSQTAFNSSVSAWHDLVFLRSLQAHEKDFIQRMREGKVKDSTKLEAELATAEKIATDLQAKLATTERDANVLEGKLETAKQDINNLEGKLATSQKETTDLRSKFAEAVEESRNLKDELVKTKTQGCPALTHILEHSYEMLSKSRGLDKEWDTDF